MNRRQFLGSIAALPLVPSVEAKVDSSKVTPFTGDEMREYRKWLDRLTYRGHMPEVWLVSDGFYKRAMATLRKLDGDLWYTDDLMALGYDHVRFLGTSLIRYGNDAMDMFTAAKLAYVGYTMVMYPFGYLE